MTTSHPAPANHVRVRVKEGAKLNLGRTGNKSPRLAEPGSWINLPADWLKQAAIAAAVETEEQYAQAAVDKDRELGAQAKQSEEAADYFYKSRAAHRANAMAAVGAREAAERMSAEGVLDELGAQAKQSEEAAEEDADPDADSAPDENAGPPPEGGKSRVRRKS